MAEKDSFPANGPSKAGFEPSPWFWDTRRKGPSFYGTLAFAVLRSLDLPFQFWYLRSGAGAEILRTIGAAPVHQPTLPSTTNALGLGLSPYHAMILGLACGSSLKQIYWKVSIGDTVMPPYFAGIVAIYNTLLNTMNTTLALWIVTSQQPSDQSSLSACLSTAPLALRIGLVLYSVGLLTEWWCEIQRKAFKREPHNQGKPYSGGLFSLARNINYGGYAIWRSGYSLICGGGLWAAVMCSWLAFDFVHRAVPSMDAYCAKKYGAQWDEVRRKVPYVLLPWVY